ncbi:GAF domain-containing protein [Rhodohalobacter mucosus]|uniref:GAF domain-containing protein n=1 Tax=Rhodohalobacter mucosus TaxID=2079485 RepID=A0A316TQE7_9BACT|nr:GAF domain-containing protein [Rhodohalobacter mucosus]PWN06843.1 GAF domain-containing protein [Rhodohalobacter mucosus]
MPAKREEKALLEFKHAVDDVVRLLRKASEAQTVYLYWVNRQRGQFVLETSSTILQNVMFEDRVGFEAHYLDGYKDIEQITQLKVQEDVPKDALKHYHEHIPVRFLTLVPFTNNGETVAVTVIETEEQISTTELEETLSAYRNALLNLLNTYLELTDLYEVQREWPDYEESLEKLSPRLHKVENIKILVEEMQKLLPSGDVLIVARGMDSWVSLIGSKKGTSVTSPGLMVEEKSMAYDALQKGTAQFSMHFNQNPKRISSLESDTRGATLAIPVLINDRRHAVVLAYDKNPLVFKESTKHQLKNVVRVASLSIQVHLGKIGVDEDLLTSEYGSFIPEMWEYGLEVMIANAGKTERKGWFGFAGVENAAELRSRFRLETLKKLQKLIVKKLNPAASGYSGYIGFNSDYIYSFLLYSEDENEYAEWKKSVEKIFAEPLELIDGQKAEVSIKMGSVYVDGPGADIHDVMDSAKEELSAAMKENVKDEGNN